MIISETFEFKPEKMPPDVDEIENFIEQNGIEPVRYALIKKNEDKFILAVSGIKKLK